MKTYVTTLGIKERFIQGILELFILDLKRYHILHLVPEEIKKLESVKMRLKNGNRQIAHAAYAEHIYFRLALCNCVIIQSEAFFRFSFINIYCTINICTPANIWCG